MTYVRKTRDCFDVLAMHDRKWYFLCTCYTREDAITAARAYNNETGKPTGVTLRREKLNGENNEIKRNYFDPYKIHISRIWFATMRKF